MRKALSLVAAAIETFGAGPITPQSGVAAVSPQRTGAVLTGTVTTGNDQPVRRARIAASGPVVLNADTDVDGRFVLGGAPPGTYTIAAATRA